MLVARDAGRFERAQHRRQDELVGHRPGDVADDDAGGLLALRQLGERLRADGVGERRVERRRRGRPAGRPGGSPAAARRAGRRAG